MPPAVKKGFSVTILTTISTSIILAILGWFSNTSLVAHDNNIDMGYVQEEVKEIKQGVDDMKLIMNSFVAISHRNRIEIEKARLRLDYCEKDFLRLANDKH